jgi:hypothetical protein
VAWLILFFKSKSFLLYPILYCTVLCCAALRCYTPWFSVFHCHLSTTHTDVLCYLYTSALHSSPLTILFPALTSPSPIPPTLTFTPSYPIPLDPVLSGLCSLPRPLYRGARSCPQEQSNVRIRTGMVPGHDAPDIRSIILVRNISLSDVCVSAHFLCLSVFVLLLMSAASVCLFVCQSR